MSDAIAAAYARVAGAPGVGRLVRRARRLPPARLAAGLYGRRLLRRAETWESLEAGLRLVAGDGISRLVLGPWEGSVESEILYWLPFVRWAAGYVTLFADREAPAVVARDEAAALYGDGAATHTGGPARTRGRDVNVSPDALRRLCDAYWAGGPIRPVVRHAAYARVDLGVRPSDASPAGGYVLVDDGSDDLRGRIVTGRGASVTEVRPRTLGERAAAVAGACGMVGGWGETAALALLHGLPTLLLVSTSSAGSPHLDVVQRMARATGTSLTIADVSLLDIASETGSHTSEARPVVMVRR